MANKVMWCVFVDLMILLLILPEKSFKKILNQKINDPKMTFDPTSVKVTCVSPPKDHCTQVPWKYVKVLWIQ